MKIMYVMSPSPSPPSSAMRRTCGMVGSNFSVSVVTVPTAIPVTMVPVMVKKRTMSK